MFIVDGADESRFQETREVIDEMYTRKGLDDAGLPVIQKNVQSNNSSSNKMM